MPPTIPYGKIGSYRQLSAGQNATFRLMEVDGEELAQTTSATGADEPVVPVVDVDPSDPELVAVLERSRETVGDLVGTTLPSIVINSDDSADAQLLGANVSKLSPMTSTLLEHTVVKDLALATTGGSFQIRRQDPGFPDAGVFLNGDPTGHGLELKAYNVLSTEITGRFRAAQPALSGKTIFVVIIAWVMDKVIHGSPLILDFEFIDAMSVATHRDEHYNHPPRYLVSPPDENEGRGLAIQLRNVEGHVLQPSSSKADLAKVKVISDALIARAKLGVPHHPETSELTRYLRQNLTYRLDTNFAKVDRINHPQIEAFKARTLDHVVEGRLIREWRSALQDLRSKEPAKRESALATLLELY